MSMDQIIREEARLTILRALAEQPHNSLNEALLQTTLETFGISRTRSWIRDELRYLGDMGAVKLSEAGTVMIAALTIKGNDHVERRLVIEGVKRPSPEE